MVVPPSTELAAFNCPWCHAYCQFRWHSMIKHQIISGDVSIPATPASKKGHIGSHEVVGQSWVATCSHCRKELFWVDGSMVYPALQTVGPNPDADMPKGIAEDYDEARAIAERSPRGAAALLRLCLQKLCVELGQPGKNLNDDIGKLVEKGLPVEVQQGECQEYCVRGNRG